MTEFDPLAFAIGLGVILALFSVLTFVWYFFADTCPSCGRRFAFK